MLQCRVRRNASEEEAPRDDAWCYKHPCLFWGAEGRRVVLHASVSFLPWVGLRKRQAHLSAALGSVRALTSCKRGSRSCELWVMVAI